MNEKTDLVENLIAQDYVRARLSPVVRCCRCGFPLLISECDDYAYQCLNCDEDFYHIETVDAKNHKPTKEEFKTLVSLAKDFLHDRIPIAAKYQADFEGLYRFLNDACDLYGAAAGKQSEINTYCSGYYHVVAKFNIENFRIIDKDDSEKSIPTLEDIINKCQSICSCSLKKRGKHQYLNGFVTAYNDILSILERIQNQKEYDYDGMLKRLFHESNEVNNIFHFCSRAGVGKYAFSPYGINKNATLVIEKCIIDHTNRFHATLFNRQGKEIETVYSIPFNSHIFTAILRQYWEREYQEDEESSSLTDTQKQEIIEKAYSLLSNVFPSQNPSNTNNAIAQAIDCLGEYLNN